MWCVKSVEKLPPSFLNFRVTVIDYETKEEVTFNSIFDAKSHTYSCNPYSICGFYKRFKSIFQYYVIPKIVYKYWCLIENVTLVEKRATDDDLILADIQKLKQIDKFMMLYGVLDESKALNNVSDIFKLSKQYITKYPSQSEEQINIGYLIIKCSECELRITFKPKDNLNRYITKLIFMEV